MMLQRNLLARASHSLESPSFVSRSSSATDAFRFELSAFSFVSPFSMQQRATEMRYWCCQRSLEEASALAFPKLLRGAAVESPPLSIWVIHLHRRPAYLLNLNEMCTAICRAPTQPLAVPSCFPRTRRARCPMRPRGLGFRV